jgi:hypothetical protein
VSRYERVEDRYLRPRVGKRERDIRADEAETSGDEAAASGEGGEKVPVQNYVSLRQR